MLGRPARVEESEDAHGSALSRRFLAIRSRFPHLPREGVLDPRLQQLSERGSAELLRARREVGREPVGLARELVLHLRQRAQPGERLLYEVHRAAR